MPILLLKRLLLCTLAVHNNHCYVTHTSYNALLLLICFFCKSRCVCMSVCVRSTWTVVPERLCMLAQQIQQKSSNKTQDKGHWMWCKAQHQGYFIYMFIIKLCLHALVYAITPDFSTLSKMHVRTMVYDFGGSRFFLSEHILQISGVNTVIIRCRQRVSGTHHDTAEGCNTGYSFD